jgi:hypothetical protein
MDRSHLRWFTRTTILEMFQQARRRRIPPDSVIVSICHLSDIAGQ